MDAAKPADFVEETLKREETKRRKREAVVILITGLMVAALIYFEVVTTFWKVRFWLLEKIAGKHPVAINLCIRNGTLDLTGKTHGFLCHCEFHDCDTALRL